ncbi:MAG: GDP-mannose 4,6-dehydratase [Bacteroidetes bacterium]|nr:GDP-mannose 4,6-dehydratase [Bacteroidota bacterium]
MSGKINVLVTGGAGFIGSHLVDALLEDGNYKVTCIDSFDDFYDPQIKRENISRHLENDQYSLIEADIRNTDQLLLKLEGKIDIIVHLAAKAGVRESIRKPVLFQEINVAGLQSILEIARIKGTKQFVFGSSSSVYGINPNYPWSESDSNLLPVSPYAASKIAGEWLCRTYQHMHGIRFVALRFFTVFGPRQRPDLAINNFAQKIISGKPIDFFGDGNTLRDYTYVADIVSGIIAAMKYDKTMFEVVNLGNNHPVSLSEMVATLEAVLNRKAVLNKLPMQEGDVPSTCADITKAKGILGYHPATSFEEGIKKFVAWKLG